MSAPNSSPLRRRSSCSGCRRSCLPNPGPASTHAWLPIPGTPLTTKTLASSLAVVYPTPENFFFLATSPFAVDRPVLPHESRLESTPWTCGALGREVAKGRFGRPFTLTTPFLFHPWLRDSGDLKTPEARSRDTQTLLPLESTLYTTSPTHPIIIPTPVILPSSPMHSQDG